MTTIVHITRLGYLLCVHCHDKEENCEIAVHPGDTHSDECCDTCGRPVMHVTLKMRQTLGELQEIDFTEADGTITKRKLRPVLDENGSWLYWI